MSKPKLTSSIKNLYSLEIQYIKVYRNASTEIGIPSFQVQSEYHEIDPVPREFFGIGRENKVHRQLRQDEIHPQTFPHSFKHQILFTNIGTRVSSNLMITKGKIG